MIYRKFCSNQSQFPFGFVLNFWLAIWNIIEIIFFSHFWSRWRFSWDWATAAWTDWTADTWISSPIEFVKFDFFSFVRCQNWFQFFNPRWCLFHCWFSHSLTRAWLRAHSNSTQLKTRQGWRDIIHIIWMTFDLLESSALDFLFSQCQYRCFQFHQHQEDWHQAKSNWSRLLQ